MRLLAATAFRPIMDRLNWTRGHADRSVYPLQHYRNAQKKVEGRNFAIRKNVLHDDVMNRQREIIYEQRDRVLKRRQREASRLCP